MNQAAKRTRKRASRWLVRLALLATSILGVSLVLEFVLRTQVPPPFVTVLQTSAVEGLPYQLRPGFSTLYFGHRADINQHGFRGPEIAAKRPGVRRIALVGDSVTFGHVDFQDTLGAHLAAALRERGEEAEVLNCGVPGYYADHVAVMLEAQVLALEPDVVVYVFCFNDPPLPGPTRQPVISPHYVVDPKIEFLCRSALLELLGRTLKAGMRRFGFASAQGYVAETLNNWKQGGDERLRETLQKMQDVCQARNISFLVAISPTLVRAEANPYAEIEKGTKELCGTLSLCCVDLREAFAPDERLERLQVGLYDSHPNGAANQRLAQVLAEALRQNAVSVSGPKVMMGRD